MAGSEKILGVEGGGTKTSWVLVERGAEGLRAIDQGKLPASNFRLTPPDKLQAIFRQMPADIACAGIFLAGCGAELGERQQRFAIMLVCVGLVGASARAFVRSGDWVDPENFYRRTLAAGGNSFRLRTNLAQICLRRGDRETARNEYREMLAATPDYPPARTISVARVE